MKKRPDTEKMNALVNPLTLADFKVIVRKVVDGKKFTMKDGKQIPVEVEYEYEEYVKLFVNPSNRKLIAMLDDSARKLLLWILFEIESGEDWIWINKVRYMQESEIKSLNTYKTGLHQLIELTILCPSSVTDVYWINPRMFFNGSRIKKFKKHVEEYQPKEFEK